MKVYYTLFFLFICFNVWSQTAEIRGQFQDAAGGVVAFANVGLYNLADSSLVKAETSNEAGIFQLRGLAAGNYFLVATYVGFADYRKADLQLGAQQQLDLGILRFEAQAVELTAATVKASRAMIEVKPDRTVFNVEGTINSIGADALALMRKAPGIMVDNNDNITVLGRSGVLIYVDGKRLPLAGQELSNYLQNLQAEQIDRIDIITNPGAKYEAEGNAGIIDIRLKKDKNLGANGSINGNMNQGHYNRSGFNANGNYRNKALNAFGSIGAGRGTGFTKIVFESFQNALKLNEYNRFANDWQQYNYRVGADFFLGKNHTLGFIVNEMHMSNDRRNFNRIVIANQATPTMIDSILIANNTADDERSNNAYNVNYRFDNKKGRSLNIDLDYGKYESDSRRLQPNQYYAADEETLLTQVINSFHTPSDIAIYTAKADFEDKLWGGTLGAGAKLSRVVSDNSFLFYDGEGVNAVQNNRKSNLFEYDENVYAGYLSYNRSLGKKWSLSAGLRAEQTDATGDLQAFLPELQEPPVVLNYLSWFPSAGLVYQITPQNTLALNYGRRINRPDYNVLNPFNNQLSQLSYEKGNPFLRPEIVTNVELGYTLNFRYNFKLAYSRTTDQITRLIAPDDEDSRANFITWANLAEQIIYSANISAPIQIKKWWNAYFNISASYLNNQADYGDGAVVDVQAFTYNIYQQHTFDLPAGFKGEISGYYSGPGIWGGVFKYESSWSLDLGLQRKFLRDQLNIKLSANDIFYQSGWDGVSIFDGLTSTGYGRWDSRRVTLSISYNFGNQNVKSRRRNTGLEDEAGRVGE